MRKRRSGTRAAAANSLPGRLRRFLRAACLSALTTFIGTSCVLNPQWRDSLVLDPILSRFSLPEVEQNSRRVVSSGAQVQTRFSQCPQFFPGGKAPVVPAGRTLRELCFSPFAILHNGQTKTPVFVVERLNRQMLVRGHGLQRTDRFYAEARLPAAERAELGDYQGSGYSRGHMAPAGDMYSAEAMAQSFSLANMIPQNQRQNAGSWRRIEQDTRKYVMRAAGDVYIFTGPVYGGKLKSVGTGNVAVPSHLYKLIYDATSGRAWVHWQANSPDAKAGPPISYNEFVRRTGLRLLPSD